MEQILVNSKRDRAALVKVLLDILRPLKRFYSPGFAKLKVGETGAHYDDDRAQMEGFARVLWGVGPLLSVPNDALSEAYQAEIGEWEVLCRKGLIHGTDPDHEEYWGILTDYDQMMVEMAPIATAILLSPDKFWKPLSEQEKQNLYHWMNQINKKQVYGNNWTFFRILVNLAFQTLGMEWDKDQMKKDLDTIEGLYLSEGWYCDGNQGQIDYYIPFAIQFYSLIAAKYGLQSEKFLKRAETFYNDFIYWFAEDGSEISFGRSLTYRFAHGSFFSAYVLAGLGQDNYGEIKTLIFKHLEGWLKKPIFDNSGVLSIGYGYPNLFMSEAYNAPGSPYWCLKLFLLLGLPAEHPFWSGEEKSYQRDAMKLIRPAQMLLANDGGDHVMAFPSGLYCMEHGNSDAKYQKFVYSNLFGFSVSRGRGLEEGAFDNALAIAFEEGNYQMRKEVLEWKISSGYTWQRYQITKDVKIETYVIPCMPWHMRIHKIRNQREITAVDCGFSISRKDITIQKENHRIIIEGNKLRSGAEGDKDGEAILINAFPNTNLLHPRTAIPAIKYHLKPGEHVIIDFMLGQHL